MTAITTLIGQLKGVFGKTYLFAGVLPALVLLLGWLWYAQGLDEVRQTLTLASAPTEEKRAQSDTDGAAAATQSPSEGNTPVATDLLFRILILLSIALIFFASRHLLLQLFQALPGRILAIPRAWLLWSKDRRRRQAGVALDFAEWRMTVITWPEKGFFSPQDAPLRLSWRYSRRALVRGRKARRVLEQCLQGSTLTRWRMATIVRGLSALYLKLKSSPNDHECSEEVQCWKDLFSDSRWSDKRQRIWSELKISLQREVHMANRTFASFPSAAWTMPTDLGNALAVLDDYAQTRYRVDTSSLWLRIWGILSKQEQQDVRDGQLGIEVMLNLCAALLTLAAIIFLYESVAIYQGLQWSWPIRPRWRLIGFTLGSVVLATIAYRGAVFAANAYADRVKRYVDLRRLQLIRELGYKAPATVNEERDLFEQLGRFFVDGAELDGATQLRSEDSEKNAEQDPADSTDSKSGQETVFFYRSIVRETDKS